MPNSYFQFKQFTVYQDQCAMKVTTDACLFGAWVAAQQHASSPLNVLDAGAGTGLLSLMLAQAWPAAKMTGVELDSEAAKQAARNCAASPWSDRLHIEQGDILEYQPAERFDILVSNPPFYEQDLRSPDPLRNRAHHDTGLTLKALVARFPQVLKPGAGFYLLLPYRRRQEAQEILQQGGGCIHKLAAVRPAGHLDYFRVLIAGVWQGPAGVELMEEEWVIRNRAGDYTEAFIRLLQPYYLYL